MAGTSDNTILLNRQQSVVQCTVADLSSRTYFFESSVSPNIIWVKLDKLDFTKTQKLDLTLNSDRVGDVTADFKVTELFVTLAPDGENYSAIGETYRFISACKSAGNCLRGQPPLVFHPATNSVHDHRS